MTQHDSLSSSYKELDRYWVRVVILSRWRTWPPAPTKDTLQVPGPGPPRGLANPGSRRQLLGLRSNLPSSLFYPHCSPNPLRLWRRGTSGGGAEVRNYWATPCTPGVPPNPRRICGPRRPSQTSLPCEFRDSTIRRVQVLSYPQTRTNGTPRGRQAPHPLPWPCSAALSPPPDSPGPPPPSAGAEPFASLWASRRRSTAPAAAAAGAAEGQGAAAGRRRGPGGAWRAAAPGLTELGRRDPGARTT